MNRYFKEVLDAHELIRDWLGDPDAQVEICDDLLSRFSPAWSMVTASGALLDFPALDRFFRTQRGARQGLSIDIEEMQIVAENENGATLIYKERQHIPGENTTCRFSTVVFEIDPDGKIIWRHLHETMLA